MSCRNGRIGKDENDLAWNGCGGRLGRQCSAGAPSCTESAKHGGKSIRSRSQSLVNDDLLIDFPADTYLHMMHGGLNLDAVTDVIITHAHEDHFYPEDLANRQSGYTRFRAPHAFNVYGNDAVCAAYERVASVIGNDEMPQVVPMHEIFEYQPLRLAHYTVYPMLADHNPREKCYIYIIRDERDGKTLLYAHDTGYLKEECWSFMKAFRFDLVSLDCTHGKEAGAPQSYGDGNLCRGEGAPFKRRYGGRKNNFRSQSLFTQLPLSLSGGNRGGRGKISYACGI